jgi:peptidoglycan/LPS O-acetylase OafA/YrhL
VHTRLSYVDGLRAVAVLSVMVFHARVHAPGVALEGWAKECSHGVDLFFVLSGFCLALPTLEKLARNGRADFDTVGFALKRLLRIVPPYAAALALATIAGVIFMREGIVPPGGMPPSFDASDVLANLLFLDRDHVLLNRSFWSLAVEFRWYLIFPFALLLAARNMRAFATAIVLVALGSEFTRATSTDLGVLPAFLLGIAAAWVRVRHHALTRYAIPLGLLSVAVALVDELRPHFPIQTNVGWHAAAFFFVIFAGAQPIVQRVLAAPLLVRIGTASYSIYLVHEPIVAAVMAALRPVYGDAVASGAALAAGLAAGFALWAVVERPLTRPETVAAFVRRGRARVLELLAVSGIPPAFALGAPALAVSLRALPLPIPAAPAVERTAV